ncbi:MAG: B12-binding domain-containing protein [Vulcanimicrobiaceae bacterium]
MASRSAHDALAFEAMLAQFWEMSGAAASDLGPARQIYRQLVADVIANAPGAIYVDFAWQADGRAYLVVEDFGPLREGRLRRPTLLGTIAASQLPLTRSSSIVPLRSRQPLQPFTIFRRMEMGRWIERNAEALGREARDDLTALGVPPPPHDAAEPGRSEIAMVADIGRTIYSNTFGLWLRDLRWIGRITAARGISAERLNKEWQAVFHVIGSRLPVADTGILRQMREAVAGTLISSLNAEPDVHEGTPAAAFLASFATQEGPRAEYLRLRGQGVSDEDIFCDVLTPAQLESGRRWQLGQMTIAEEHRRTAAVRELIARARQNGRDQAPDSFCVITACPPSERHNIGLEMATTLLRARGIRVEYLGPAVAEEVLLAAMLHDAQAVLLSATMTASVHELIGLIDLLKEDERTNRIPVALGGGPFNELPELRAILGADLILIDPRHAILYCEQLREQGESFSDSA